MSVGAILPQAQAGSAAARSNRVAQEHASVNTPQMAEQRADDAKRVARQQTVQAIEQSHEVAEHATEAIEHSVEVMNRLSETMGRTLSFEVHQPSGHMLVRVVDRETGEVIRSVPPEELLDMTAKIRELAGMLFDGRG